MQKIIKLLGNACFLWAGIGLFTVQVSAQPPENESASRIVHEMHRAAHFGRVLYLAAHPDDENTRLIAYFNQTEKATAGYLSLTRGDGGQNLIGLEKGEGLGLIRTHELLEARKIDGGRQFFTRAIDFGYSKSPEETLDFWGKRVILSDVVQIIRTFRPDIIICRFPEDGRGGHGHHTASAILAREAFFLAASDTAFPEQLEKLQPHQTARLFFNTSSWWIPELQSITASNDSILVLDVGQYNTLLGDAPNECAARSRSMHKSQGFGSAPARGEQLEYLVPLEGPAFKADLWEGIPRRFRDFQAGSIDPLFEKLIRGYRAEQPEASIPELIRIHRAISAAGLPEHLELEKTRAVEQLILMCAGFRAEVRCDAPNYTPGSPASLTAQFLVRNTEGWQVEWVGLNREVELARNRMESVNITTCSAPDQTLEPYWLRNEHSSYLFELDSPDLLDQPVRFPSWGIPVKIKVGKLTIHRTVPVYYHRVDPVRGEVYEVPPILTAMSVETKESTLFMDEEESVKVQVGIRSYQAQEDVVITPEVSDGFRVFPASVRVGSMDDGVERWFEFNLTADSTAGEGVFKPVVHSSAGTFQDQWHWMEYDHLPKRAWRKPAELRLVAPHHRVNADLKLAYIMGSGDEVPIYLEQLGYSVELLDENSFAQANLNKYHAVIVGIRAYNVHDWLARNASKTERYIRQGGRWIVQYQTRGFNTDLLPVPFEHGRDRVTDETADVVFLNPHHPLLKHPHKLSASDFEGWVQERGLYFASSWPEAYSPLLSWADADEPQRTGGLIVAPYHDGCLIYTGISFFRQLPAGVPGAARLLINLIEGPLTPTDNE